MTSYIILDYAKSFFEQISLGITKFKSGNYKMETIIGSNVIFSGLKLLYQMFSQFSIFYLFFNFCFTYQLIIIRAIRQIFQLYSFPGFIILFQLLAQKSTFCCTTSQFYQYNYLLFQHYLLELSRFFTIKTTRTTTAACTTRYTTSQTLFNIKKAIYQSLTTRFGFHFIILKCKEAIRMSNINKIQFSSWFIICLNFNNFPIIQITKTKIL